MAGPHVAALWLFVLAGLFRSGQAQEGTIRINCGGETYVDNQGHTWEADRYFVDGSAVPVSAEGEAQYTAAGYPGVELYGTHRVWTNTSGSYAIPLPPGNYMVRLYFTEMEYVNPQDRTFAIQLNGYFAAAKYNVFKSYVPNSFEFIQSITWSNLTITLTPYQSSAYVSGLEIVPIASSVYREQLTTDAVLLTYSRINLGDEAVLDYLGRFWSNDSPASYPGLTTETITTTKDIRGTNSTPDYLPAGMYQSARKSVPLTPGTAGALSGDASTTEISEPSYLLLRFHFAELEYSAAGDRILDIYVNDRLEYSGLDVVAEVGPLTAYHKDIVVQAVTANFSIRANAASLSKEPLLNGLEVFLIDATNLYPPPPDGTVRINCGGQFYADPYGNDWQADKYYVGGEARQADSSLNNGLVNNGTTMYPLLTAYRRWPSDVNNSYEIPLPTAPGLFWVRLYFAEFEYASVAQRAFEVYLDGFQVIDNFRIVKVREGYNWEFSMPVKGPSLTITFGRREGDPFISAIEIVPMPAGEYQQTLASTNILRRAYRFNCGGQDLVDAEGRMWHADDPSIYGNPNSRTANVVHSLVKNGLSIANVPMALYQSERKIDAGVVDGEGLAAKYPVVSGTDFLVRLHFSEFTYSQVGDRILDIYINGELVLGGLDMVKDSGPNATLAKDFQVVKPARGFFIKVSVKPNDSSRVKEPTLSGVEIFSVLPGPKTALDSSDLSKAAIIGITVGSLALFLLLLVLGLFILRRQIRKNRKLMWEDIADGPGGEELMARLNQRMVRIIPLKEIKAATDNFSETSRLGTGGFSTVYCGVLNGEKVAMKRVTETSPGSLEDFVYEVELISQLNHVNLLRLLGFCTEKGEQIFVTEYMEQGTVQDHLHAPPGSPAALLTLAQRIGIAVGSARGLNYLHSFAKEPIIHRDVKSENILLDQNFQAQLADFGLLKRLEDKQGMEGVFGTRGYLDPECFTTFNVTTKSDVYSFGVVLLELVTGKPPIVEVPEQPTKTQSLVSWVKLMVNNEDWDRLPDDRLPMLSSEQDAREKLRAIVELALRCVEQFRSDRPDMNEVQLRLEEIAGGELCFSEKPSAAPPSAMENVFQSSEGGAGRNFAWASQNSALNADGVAQSAGSQTTADYYGQSFFSEVTLR